MTDPREPCQYRKRYRCTINGLSCSSFLHETCTLHKAREYQEGPV